MNQEQPADRGEAKGATADTRRSLVALDSTNFFLADVETGTGPFVATYLSAQNHWNPSQIGLVTGAQNMAAVLAQWPAGWWIDRSRHKTWLVAGGALLLSLGSLLVIYAKTVALQVLNQALLGVALAVILPSVSAISLGIVGKAGLSPRIGRNGMFVHIGNTATALLAGYLAARWDQRWIFYLSAVLGLFAVLSALTIRRSDVNDEVARSREGEHIAPAREALTRPMMLRFLALIVLFHVANGSMLPLAGQELAHRVHGASGTFMSACIVLAQMVMVPVAYLCGRWADRTGRKPLFLIGFTALLLRGVLYAFVTEPHAVVAIEALDGLGTALAGVTSVLVISDLAKGTGRFNFLQGVAQAALGVGAFAGKAGSGWIAKSAGYPAAFFSLSAVAALGLVAFALWMPETLRRETR